MDGFQHEAALLREVAGGLEERLSALADWTVFRRTGHPPEPLAADPRFQAWQACQDALEALVRNARGTTSVLDAADLVGAGVETSAKTPTPPSYQGASRIPVSAAPRQALARQVAAVEVVHPTSERSGEPGPDPIAKPMLAETNEVTISDDLTRIRGISRAVAKQLNDLGVFRIAQIAAWSATDVQRIKTGLDCGDRISRENWIERAAVIAGSSLSDQSSVSPAGLANNRSEPAEPSTDQVASEAEADGERDEATGNDIETSAVRLRRVRRLPLPRFERPTASVGVVHPEAAPTTEPVSRTPEAPKPAPDAPSEVKAAARLLPQPEPILDPLAIHGVTSDDLHALAAMEPLTTVEIAQWKAADVQRAEAALERPGRVRWENWIEQATLLSAGVETKWSRDRPLMASQTMVPTPAQSKWSRRIMTSPVNAPSSVTTVDSLDARIARLQAEVERIRELPELSPPANESTGPELPEKTSPPTRLSERLRTITLDPAPPERPETQSGPSEPAVAAGVDDTGALDVPQWDDTVLDVEEAAVSIVPVPPPVPNELREPAPSPPEPVSTPQQAPRSVPLEQRLQTTMTSMRRRRLQRDEVERLPPPNYAETPEEASVQIIRREPAEPKTNPEAVGERPDDVSGKPATDAKRQDSRKGVGTQRYIKALTGER